MKPSSRIVPYRIRPNPRCTLSIVPFLLPLLVPLLVVCTSTTPSSTRSNASIQEAPTTTSTTAFKVEFDTRNAEAVLAALEGRTSMPASFDSLPGTRLLVQKGRSRDAALTVDRYRAAVEDCAKGTCVDGQVLKLAATNAKREPLKALLSRLATERDAISREAARRVGENIPALGMELVVPVRLVLGGRSDGYVEELDGRQEMAIDVRTILQRSDEGTENQLWALMIHEVWHVAFLAHVKRRWAVSDPEAVADPAYALVFAMLNEGYAHYLSILAYARWSEEKASELLDGFEAPKAGPGFLSLFQGNVDAFLAAGTSRRAEMVGESHIADRMEAKWGAMTGARMIADLRKELGLTATVALLENGATGFIDAYRSLKRPRVKMTASFDAIVELAKKAEMRPPGSPAPVHH